MDKSQREDPFEGGAAGASRDVNQTDPYICPSNHNPIKSLFANISLVVLLNILVKPVWLLVEMEIQDVVGHEEWGMYAALLSFGFLFITLADLGINQYTTQTLASQPELLKTHFPNLFSTKIILALLYPFVMMGAGWLIGYDTRQLYLLGQLCLVHGGVQIVMFFRANFQAMQRFKLDGMLSIFERVALLGLVGVLFVTDLDIDRFVYARLIAIGVSVVICYLVLVRFYGWLLPRLDPALVKKIMRYSLAFALMTVMYSVHDRVDQVMLERLAGEKETGLYAGAYRWLDGFSMYLWTVLPIFFARFAFFIHDQKEQEKLLHFGQVVVALPMIFVSIFVFFYGEKLLFLFDRSTGEELHTMEMCLRALFVAAMLNGICAIFSTLLTATHHVVFVNWLGSASILLNIILNFIFIPKYGAVASAWATTASYAVMNIGYVVYIQRRLTVRVPYRQMGKLLLVAMAAAAIFWGGMLVSLPWYVNSAIAGVGCLVSGVSLQLIPISFLLRNKSDQT